MENYACCKNETVDILLVSCGYVLTACGFYTTVDKSGGKSLKSVENLLISCVFPVDKSRSARFNHFLSGLSLPPKQTVYLALDTVKKNLCSIPGQDHVQNQPIFERPKNLS